MARHRNPSSCRQIGRLSLAFNRREKFPPRANDHRHAVLRTQRDQRVWLDSKARLKTELKMAVENDGHDHEFLQGKMVPDAASRPGPEGKVNHCLRRRAAFGRKTRRLELLRRGPKKFAPVEM